MRQFFKVGWPFSPPDTILDLVHLESVHDVFDLYLWLSYRFQVSLKAYFFTMTNVLSKYNFK